MTITSYAQNFEDIMLQRALKGVEQGFYIDVGANDPEIDSVTKAFYVNGWRGINIEPVSEWYQKLEKHRPNDINLQIAAGSSEGEITLFEIPHTGLSTTCKEIAKTHNKERGYDFVSKQVPVKSLRDICSQYHVDGQVHFLKIDVEGAEKEVLDGMDFKSIRPWIILIESTTPSTQIENSHNWEQLILEHEYQFVYFDGLNRFYVADEHSELIKFFKAPPNVFDDFQLTEKASFCSDLISQNNRLTEQLALDLDERENELLKLEEAYQPTIKSLEEIKTKLEKTEQEKRTLEEEIIELDIDSHRWWQEANHLAQINTELEKKLDAATNELGTLKTILDDTTTQLAILKASMSEVLNSKSWLVTKPLRELMAMTKKVFILTLDGYFRPFLRKLLKLTIKALNKLHRVRNFLLSFLRRRYPRLYEHLKLFVIHHQLQSANSHSTNTKATFQHSVDIESREQTLGLYDKSTNAKVVNVSGLSELNPDARQIYIGLVKAMHNIGKR